ncbi:rhodanese domain-containing protein CG4456-like [Zerene cesonia]|uniref:rhodanese domain-containing protein CG4456-like n=1 Tax=Zerene cesonia TaxID=33412 RepID=UPI0018E567BE|nr:rhodanese domain-containing protein CG4456-like [Zerene cesonia]
MLGRCLYRQMFASYKLITLTANHNILSYSYKASVIRVNGSLNKLDLCLHRSYSEKSKIEDVTVDFEHVKKATSNDNVYIIDVREPDEVKEYGSIPNSVNIPLGSVTPALSTMSDDEFAKVFKRQKPSENTEIIFYCMIGKRSGMAQQNAINLGYKNVKNYLGSWTDWAHKTQ